MDTLEEKALLLAKIVRYEAELAQCERRIRRLWTAFLSLYELASNYLEINSSYRAIRPDEKEEARAAEIVGVIWPNDKEMNNG